MAKSKLPAKLRKLAKENDVPITETQIVKWNEGESPTLADLVCYAKEWGISPDEIYVEAMDDAQVPGDQHPYLQISATFERSEFQVRQALQIKGITNQR